MTASSFTSARLPQSTAPFNTIIRLYRDSNTEPVSIQVYLTGFPTAGDIVGAAVLGRLPDYENWDVATISQISTGELEVFLPEDHEISRRQLIIELSRKNKDQGSMISLMSVSFAEQLREKETVYQASIKHFQTQHHNEIKNIISKELRTIKRNRGYRYFSTRLRAAKQELENAEIIATLATFDGILMGLNGLFFNAADHLDRERMEFIVASLEKYDIMCVEDLVRPKSDCTLEEEEVKKSILHILPTDYRDLAREVYASQTSLKSKVKSTILQYPRLSKVGASKIINRSDMHEKYKEIARWFIHSNPQTASSENIFGAEDGTGVEELQTEVKAIEDIVESLTKWGDPSEDC